MIGLPKQLRFRRSDAGEERMADFFRNCAAISSAGLSPVHRRVSVMCLLIFSRLYVIVLYVSIFCRILFHVDENSKLSVLFHSHYCSLQNISPSVTCSHTGAHNWLLLLLVPMPSATMQASRRSLSWSCAIQRSTPATISFECLSNTYIFCLWLS